MKGNKNKDGGAHSYPLPPAYTSLNFLICSIINFGLSRLLTSSKPPKSALGAALQGRSEMSVKEGGSTLGILVGGLARRDYTNVYIGMSRGILNAGDPMAWPFGGGYRL